MSASNLKDLFCINEHILDYERVIIYGAGVSGKGLLLKLLQHNIKVECFVDSDPAKCGTRYLNIPIVHIDELSGDYGNSAVIVCGMYALLVAEQLEKRGFRHLFLDYGSEFGHIHIKRGK